jgi:hypothetical protein
MAVRREVQRQALNARLAEEPTPPMSSAMAPAKSCIVMSGMASTMSWSVRPPPYQQEARGRTRGTRGQHRSAPSRVVRLSELPTTRAMPQQQARRPRTWVGCDRQCRRVLSLKGFLNVPYTHTHTHTYTYTHTWRIHTQAQGNKTVQ